MNALTYLNSLRPGLPASIERKASEFEPGETNPSNGEVRRWLKNRAVIVNGEPMQDNELIDFPVFSLVFFPKSAKRRTTVI